VLGYVQGMGSIEGLHHLDAEAGTVAKNMANWGISRTAVHPVVAA
jgi:hypothetical protein